MTARAINAADLARPDFRLLPPPSQRKPVSAADRALIDRHIAEHGVNHIPRGVSGLGDKKDTLAADYRGSRRGLSVTKREGLSRQRQDYRAFRDQGYTDTEIAQLLGVTVGTVKTVFRQMRLGPRKVFGDG